MIMDISKLWKSYHKKRCVTSRNKLVVHYMPLASKIARTRVQKYKFSFDELESASFRALIDAVENYDSDADATFETYSWYRIRGGVLDWLRSTNDPSKSDKVSLSMKLDEDSFDVADLLTEDPSSTVDAKMFEESMLWGLSDRERTVISLYFFKNWTQLQISKKLKVSERYVTKIRREAIYNIRCGLLLRDIRDRLRLAA